jgi:predicted HAD superfamily Cof-like phosphohydrolase
MSYNPQKDVSILMRACDQEVNDHPTLSTPEVRLLRCKLTFEEVQEFIEAAGCFIGVDEDGKFTIYTDETVTPDLLEMYDAIVDINYVNYGAAAALGLDAASGFKEVQRSNMTKVPANGKVKKNEFGKILKPECYSPPNLKKLLEKQEQ